MKYSRPLQLCSIHFFCLLLCPLLWWGSGAQATENPLATLRTEHPRLLVRAADFETLKRQLKTSRVLQRWYHSLQRRADSLLDQAPCGYDIPDGKRLLAVSRAVMDRVHTLSLLYRISGDKKYADRVWKELEQAAAFKDWNPSHFLDTAEMTHAFAIGYDWLYDVWTPAQRKLLREAIVKHGLTPGLACYQGKARYGWWVRSENNWNQVCNGGLTLGALAIADDEPELAHAIITAAIASLPIAMKEYAPDGGYHEGPGYWVYGTSYNVYLLAALESALGTDFGLSEHEGFDRTGDFPVQMMGSTGRPFNYADGSGGSPLRPGPGLWWLAKKFGENMESGAYVATAFATARPVALDLLWYAEGPEQNPPGFVTLQRYFKGPEVTAIRCSWTDPKAGFVAFKAGHPKGNHAQCDVGTFVYELNGVRWAEDLGADNYNLPGYFDRNRGRWKFYRNRAEGHNTLVINPGSGPDQTLEAHAKLTQGLKPEINGDTYHGAEADLSPAYAGHIDKALRRVLLNDTSGELLLEDELHGSGAEVWWFMHTPAKIEVQEDGRLAQLKYRKETLYLALHMEEAPAKFSTLPAAPLPGSPRVNGMKNDGKQDKLAIHFSWKSEDGKATQRNLRVFFTPDRDKAERFARNGRVR